MTLRIYTVSINLAILAIRACTVHSAIIIGTVRSLWTWLWGRYHVPRKILLIFFIYSFIFRPRTKVPGFQKLQKECQAGETNNPGDQQPKIEIKWCTTNAYLFIYYDYDDDYYY